MQQCQFSERSFGMLAQQVISGFRLLAVTEFLKEFYNCLPQPLAVSKCPDGAEYKND
jgi:hypothetical protein